MTRGKVDLAKRHRYGRFRRKLLERLREEGFDEGRVDRHLTHLNRDHLIPLAYSKDDAFEGRGFLGGLLEPFEGLAARVQFAASMRDKSARLYLVNLDALLAFSGIPEIFLALEAIGLCKGAQKHFIIADWHRAPTHHAFARLAAVQRVPDGSVRCNEELGG